MGLEEAVALIKRNTRRLAKRQMTWFRKIPEVTWYEHPYSIENMAKDITRFVQETHGEVS
jgi:tRNA dimethylallyltransferase